MSRVSSEKKKEYNKTYRFNHKDEIKEYQKKRRLTIEGKEYQKKYRQSEKGKESIKKYYEKNKNKLNELKRLWKKNNPEKVNQINIRSDKKRALSLKYRLNRAIRNSMWQSLNRNKKGRRWESLADYTVEELQKHLEKQFKPGMTWENYGKWHIDHIVPISKFNFSSPEHFDFKRCWALKNLRPLWAKENIRKHNKIDKHFQPALTL